jgi:hypothetical protein
VEIDELSIFSGARGSNTGDDYHELWALREGLRLLSREDGLDAVYLEGLDEGTESQADGSTWSGVDCTFCYGGETAADADEVVFQQLKYSAADPAAPWTVARLIHGGRKDSVLRKLARAWLALRAQRSGNFDRAFVVYFHPDPESLNRILLSELGLLESVANGAGEGVVDIDSPA